MSRRLADLPGSRVSSTLTGSSVLVLPVGSIEHHGPHLPLATDAIMAEAVATAAVDGGVAAGLDLWLLPTLTFTKSDEHAWAPGTIWLTAETLLATLVDIGRSVAATPARKLVFVNGHGGNVALLQVANRELRRRFGLQPFTMPASRGGAGSGRDGEPDEFGLGIHAGWSETSAMLHLVPDLVDTAAFVRNVPEHLAGFTHLGFNNRPVTFGWLSDDFGPTGVIGDPTGATAAAGERIVSASVAFAVEALTEIARYSPAVDGPAAAG